jgi:hypothetical protein
MSRQAVRRKEELCPILTYYSRTNLQKLRKTRETFRMSWDEIINQNFSNKNESLLSIQWIALSIG